MNPTTDSQTPVERRPYTPPVLTVHGTAQALTQDLDSKGDDGPMGSEVLPTN